MDYAQSRYYSSVQGRFTSVDPLMRSASIGEPQTFNRYSYVLNNPMNSTDPTGLCPEGRTAAVTEGSLTGLSIQQLNGLIRGGQGEGVPGAADRRTVTYTNDKRRQTGVSAATSYAPAASVSGIGYSAPVD